MSPAAAYLTSRLNLSVGQCDDFYRFVCSDRWFAHETQELPFRFSSMQYVYDTLQRYTKDALLNLLNNENLNATSALAKTLVFVENCTSSGAIEHIVSGLQAGCLVVNVLSLESYSSSPYCAATRLQSEPEHFEAVMRRFGLGLFPFTSRPLWPSSLHFVLATMARELGLFPMFAVTVLPSKKKKKHHTILINLTSFLATLFEQSHVYTKESSIAVNSKVYFHRLFTFVDTGVDESTVLNFLGVYLWVHLSPLFPDNHSSAPHLPGAPYGRPGGSKRFPLCLRYAETLCPQGMYALLTVALGQTNSSVEFVRPVRGHAARNLCEPLPTLNVTHRFLTHGVSPRDK
ncbi:hypothetical protein V5799_012164 [Amblyomma americanum]|uniref:Peptidase M13 N-terminal domain-containing protein n=1 Tax=Amblyomma americanum TaxID=6943 RepID=A0AAQ4EFJ7_AMBAM